MADPQVPQHCWNHPTREPVCRCPGCGRIFCRECVTEYEARLLCAECLKAAAGPASVRRFPAGRLLTPVLGVAGLLAAWMTFYVGGEMLMEITAHGERLLWPLR